MRWTFCSYKSHRLAQDEDHILIGKHARVREEEVGSREMEQ